MSTSSRLPYANWKDTDATNVLLLVRIRLGVPFINRSMVYVVVPGTPNPKNPVQLGMLLPRASCQYWNRHRSAKPQMWVRFPPRSPTIFQWLCRQTGYSHLPLTQEPLGSSPSRAAISMAHWSKSSLTSLSRRRRRGSTDMG